ncbi:MAG: tRNA (adenosine(37)-N6)-dimethylallyltransferase, partial [Bacteroidota bacterium]
MIAVIGPTATGKTSLAANFAARNTGEIISADSRQVYKGMDIGTGKDLSEYTVNGKPIPYHLIDIALPGEEYNVFRYQQDFLKAYQEIIKRKNLPVLCGGTGMYIEAVLKGYRLLEVPEDKKLRADLENKTQKELQQILKQFKTPHNTTDTEDRKRLIRAIEIQTYYQKHANETDFPEIDSVLF